MLSSLQQFSDMRREKFHEIFLQKEQTEAINFVIAFDNFTLK